MNNICCLGLVNWCSRTSRLARDGFKAKKYIEGFSSRVEKLSVQLHHRHSLQLRPYLETSKSADDFNWDQQKLCMDVV